MARTNAGRDLTEQHRLAQNEVAKGIVAAILKLFERLFDFDDIGKTGVEVATRATPIVLEGRARSTQLSKGYLSSFAFVETGDDIGGRLAEYVDEYTYDNAFAELLQTILATAKILMSKGYTYPEARKTVESSLAGKVTKVVADGGRSVIETEVRTGGKGSGPVGYARVVDADPCPFCAMLASRGIYYMGDEKPGSLLYKSNSFAEVNARFVGDGEFKVHDGCQCTLEPVYYQNDGSFHLPGNGDKLAKEWATVAAGAVDPFGTWRRWRESGTLPNAYDGPLDGKRRERPKRSPGQVNGTTRRARDTPAEAITVDRETVERYLKVYEERAEGIRREMVELTERGVGTNELPYVALAGELKRLERRVSTYRSHLS